MTMLITVRNEDASRTCEVKDEQFSIGMLSPDRVDVRVLGPGEIGQFCIHAARRITVTEKPVP